MSNTAWLQIQKYEKRWMAMKASYKYVHMYITDIEHLLIIFSRDSQVITRNWLAEFGKTAEWYE